MRRLKAIAASAWLVVASLAFVAAPIPVSACSCIGPQPIEAYATPDNVIIAGEVLGPDQPGIRFGVQQWFSGTEPASVVRIAGDWENGGMCGLGFVPDTGTRWIAVAFRPPSDDPLAELSANEHLQVSICQPFLDLDSPDGRQLFNDAVAAFGAAEAPPPGPGGSPSPAPPAAPAEPTATPTEVPAAPVVPAAPAEPPGPSTETMVMAAVGGVLAVGVLVLLLVAVVGRRSRAGG